MNIGGFKVVDFSIDLSTQQHLDTPIDRVPIQPVIKHESLPSGTIIAMVPVENIVADKLCACYEYHRETGASTRFHDLIDLVRIITSQPLDARKLANLIARESQRRPTASLPTCVIAPGEKWFTSYPKQASNAADFPLRYHDLNTALETVGKCLNEILAGKLISGTWSPESQNWENRDLEV